jgi:drug/metabolite transporter (DMT)-like permease
MDLSKATAIVTTMPVFSFFLAYLLLDEIPTEQQWFAFGLMVVGIGFIMKTHSKQWIQPEQ